MNVLRHWFAHPEALWLLSLLPTLAVFGLLASRRRRRALSLLGYLPALQGLIARKSRLRWLRGLCLAIGLICLIVGTAGPQWGRDWDQSAAPGRDLVVALDLSRSMFAEKPSRLIRAQRALIDLSEELQQRGGHRLALIVFAGQAREICPLTHDYDHFREVVERLDPAHLLREVRPSPGSASGTRMGAGLREAVQAHDERFRGYQDVLLISDGDDPARDGEWRAGVAAARDQGIPVHTVGVGDPEAGSPIPVGDVRLEHEGSMVLTRLEERPLQDIARLTGGTYTPAHTRALPLGELFHERIAPGAVRTEATDDVLPVYRQRYRWFLGAALALLALHLVLSRQRQPSRRSAPADVVLGSPIVR